MNKLLHVDHDRNVVLFIGKNVYKLHQGCLGSSDCLMPGYPRPIDEEFPGGPRKVTAAAYVPDNRKRTYLIKGQRVFTVYIDLLILPLMHQPLHPPSMMIFRKISTVSFFLLK